MNNVISKTITAIDTFTEWSGRSVAWLVLAMVLLICYDVAMRYLFQQGSVALQELEWHLFALIFLLGSAYTLKHDEHVRVDIIYQSQRISDKQRAIINIAGIVLFLFPFCILILVSAWPFVENAYFYHEGSPDPGGLPYRYLLKASILLGFFMLIVQGLAELLRNILKLQDTEAN
ncbi:MAG: C4-dicarboxylate ABC transporter permease [Gammaproteobacteria bacterium]|nr:TRAP transporter small permease subunit [Pseudomonadota bacterium]PCH63391.1 MAG: C4-dicarboxylate ABC transporter permease [Gammaproteobacteria bacterium]